MLINELNFKESPADPSLLQQTTSKGKVLFGLYVNDCFLVGPTEAINEAIEEVQQKFSITRTPGKLQEFVGCSITCMPDNKGFWLTQPDLVK